jgi:hypothetical protein
MKTFLAFLVGLALAAAITVYAQTKPRAVPSGAGHWAVKWINWATIRNAIVVKDDKGAEWTSQGPVGGAFAVDPGPEMNRKITAESQKQWEKELKGLEDDGFEPFAASDNPTSIFFRKRTE